VEGAATVQAVAAFPCLKIMFDKDGLDRYTGIISWIVWLVNTSQEKNMSQAIVTKYLGATNFRSSRVKATAQAGSVTVDWNDALSVEENHKQAARKLMANLGWQTHTKIIGSGELPNGRGSCFVLGRK
jgi:hypothetical protein